MERLENHYIHYSNNAALILDLGTKIRTATSQAGKYILYQYVVSFTKVENAVNIAEASSTMTKYLQF